MDFSVTAEQEMMIDSARNFAEKEIKPWLRYLEEKAGTEEAHVKAREIYKKAAELGFTSMGYPKECGGLEVDPLTIGLISEALGRYGGLSHLESGSNLCGPSGPGAVISVAGSEEQKQEWVQKIIRGDKIISIGSTEPHCGSDVSQIRTTAKREGDEYVINGEKQMIGGTRWSEAHLVYCRTSDAPGSRGISAFIVENDREGISRYQFKTFGGAFWEIGGIVYNNVRVPAKNRVGEEGRGFRLAMGMFDWMRALAGPQCVGPAQASLDESIEYAKQRTAFGKPIGKWEAVQFRISEDSTQLEAARWLFYRTLWLASVKKPYTKEASMVKWWVPTIAFNVVNNCIQNKGATGFTTTTFDELRLRFIRAYWIADGTTDIQKIIIGREILGREFVPYSKEN